MYAIATSELHMLVRNRLVFVCAILMPLAFGLLILLQGGIGDGAAFMSVIQVLIMAAMGTYVTATTTLAARRQTLFLKRLRSAAVSDRDILIGLVAPLVIINVIQVVLVTIALVISAGTLPVHSWLVIVAILAVEAMFVGFALATAGVTTSPEHAQITTLPLFFAVPGIAIWTLMAPASGNEIVGWLQRMLPGGGFAQLMTLAWNGGDMLTLPLLLIPTLAWAALGFYAARRMFRWEPRA